MLKYKKYPIGTRIIFIGHPGMCGAAKKDIGKKGKIVGYYDGSVRILLDNPYDKWRKGFGGCSWSTRPSAIISDNINCQLLFEFMYDV